MAEAEVPSIPIVDALVDTESLARFFEEAFPLEFCASLDFDPDFVERLCSCGFMPMAAFDERSGKEFLLPKLHLTRLVLEPRRLRIRRGTRRESRAYELSRDGNFNAVLAGCLEVHGDEWLRPPLVECFRRLFAERDRRRVRFGSFELYRGSRLAAGEFGFFCGSVYTSLSGFRRVSGSGSVQLAALGAALADAGFAAWDLGMELPYKYELGAAPLSRREFLALLRKTRGQSPRPGLGPMRGVSARALIDSFAAH